jgi:hypothetical protein
MDAVLFAVNRAIWFEFTAGLPGIDCVVVGGVLVALSGWRQPSLPLFQRFSSRDAERLHHLSNFLRRYFVSTIVFCNDSWSLLGRPLLCSPFLMFLVDYFFLWWSFWFAWTKVAQFFPALLNLFESYPQSRSEENVQRVLSIKSFFRRYSYHGEPNFMRNLWSEIKGRTDDTVCSPRLLERYVQSDYRKIRVGAHFFLRSGTAAFEFVTLLLLINYTV